MVKKKGIQIVQEYVKILIYIYLEHCTQLYVS
jgi:hypothetical protein